MDPKTIKVIEKIDKIKNPQKIEEELKQILDGNFSQSLFLFCIQNFYHNISKFLIKYFLSQNKTAPLNYADKYGESALHFLSRKGDVEILKLLYTSSFQPEITFNIQGLSAIHCAALENQCESLKFFYDLSPELMCHPCLNGHSPIVYALREGNFESFLFLRSYQKKTTSMNFWLSIAAMSSSSKALRYLLDCDQDPNFCAFDAVPAIYQSALFGQEENFHILWPLTNIKRLLTHLDQKSVRKLRRSDQTPEYKSDTVPTKKPCKSKKTQSQSKSSSVSLRTEDKLEKNTKIKSNDRQSSLGQSSSSSYCTHFHQRRLLPATSLLTNKIDLWFKSHRNAKFLLHWAVEGRISSIVEKVAQSFPLLVNSFDDYAQTPLHYASRQKDSKLTLILLKQAANPFFKNKDFRTPLEEAAFYGSLKNVEVLIDLYEKPIKKTVPLLLHQAAFSGEISLVRKLIDYGYSAYSYHSPDKMLPHHYSAINNHQESYDFLIKKSLEHRPSIVQKDAELDYLYASCLGNIDRLEKIIKFTSGKMMTTVKQCSAPIHLAARYDKYDCVRYLWNLTRNPLEPDYHGYTIVHYAAVLGNLEMLSFLLDKGASLNLKDRYLKTPLHYAAEFGQTEIAYFLLSKGAKLFAQDLQKFNALDVAILKNRFHVWLTLMMFVPQKNKKRFLLRSTLQAVNWGHTQLVISLLLTLDSQAQRLSLAKCAARCIGAADQKETFNALLFLNFGSKEKLILTNEALEYARTKNHPEQIYLSMIELLRTKITERDFFEVFANQSSLSKKNNNSVSPLLFSSSAEEISELENLTLPTLDDREKTLGFHDSQKRSFDLLDDHDLCNSNFLDLDFDNFFSDEESFFTGVTSSNEDSAKKTSKRLRVQ